MSDTKEGGMYEDAPDAGTFHDANGKPVTKDGKPVEKGAKK